MNTNKKIEPMKNKGTKDKKEAASSLRSKLTLIAATLASLSAPAMAQIIVNGTTVNAPAGTVVDTGAVIGTAGYAVNVTNNGHFIADGNISLTTGGNTANTIAVSGTGSSALLANGSTMVTSGNTSHGAYIQNNGQVTLDQANITTSGISSVGINAVTGGSITLRNSTINTSGNASQGVAANNSGIVTIENSTIATTGGYQGNGASGIHIANGSTGSVTGSSVSTQGASSGGIFVETTNSANTSFTITDTIVDTYASAGVIASELNGVGSSTVTLNGNNQITTRAGAGISARGAGGKAIVNGGTTVTTLGANSVGIQATANGGQVTISNSTVNTNGTNSAGMMASDAGSKITSTNVTVTTQQNGSYGLNATLAGSIEATGNHIQTNGDTAHGANILSGGLITLNGGGNTINTSGAGAYGVNATGANSKLITNGSVQINTTGSNGIGVYVAGFGQVDLGNGSVIKTSTNGAHTNAYGLYANGSNGVSGITASNVTVETGSSVGHGIYAANAGGEIYINGANNKVTTTGSGAYGLIASRTDSKIVVSDKIEITTTGDKANGVSVSNQGGVGSVLIDLGTGSVVNTNNLGAKGLVSNYLGSLLKGRDISVNTGTGADSYGAYVLDQAELQLTGGQIVTAGSNAHGVYATGAGTAVTLDNTRISVAGAGAHAIMSNAGAETTITQLNNVLSSTQGTTLYSEGGFIEANLDGSLIQNNGMLVDAKVDANSGLFSRIDLNAKNLSMSGDIQAESSSMANLSLSHATWNGKATNATNFKLDDSSVWNMSASSDVANLDHAGQINFAAPTGDNFNTLTVRSNYTGNDGTIALHTKLGDDGSPSDQLIVTGDTSGSSKLHITNAGGLGALTVADGIQVVNVAGASNGSFGLANRVTTGLYEYDLFQNGVGANAADGNWYLRSLAVIPTEPTVYLRNLSAASNMFMHTLHDRLGEPQFTDTYKTGDRNPSSVWVRVTGNHTESKGGNGQVDLDTDTSLVHIGGDIARFSNDNNDRLVFGLMGAYGHSKIDASANQMPTTASGISRNATGKIDGYSVGGYATWYGNQDKPTGAYVDGWAQYGWYDNKVQGNTQREESYNSSGWTASVEAGYAFIAQDKNERQLMIEPQIQVAYNSYKADDYTDQNGTRISNSDADGVITRVGARVYSRSKLGDNGLQPFVEANWWYSDAKNTLAFNGETMSDGTPNSRYELKAGLQGEVAKNWLMWGHVGGQWGEKSYSRYEGMVGIKRMF